MDIYIFGSLVRGDLDKYSDVDLLLIQDEKLDSPKNLDKQKFSIYTKKRIQELWKEGNPFAWHLYLESKLVHSSGDIDFLRALGRPARYNNLSSDLIKFYQLYITSLDSYQKIKKSDIFDLGMIFLAIRNFATCYSLGRLNTYHFNRDSAFRLEKNNLKISEECFRILEKCRIASTRGDATLVDKSLFYYFDTEYSKITKWFLKILNDENIRI